MEARARNPKARSDKEGDNGKRAIKKHDCDHFCALSTRSARVENV